jgi:hypothetical protein
MVSEKLKLQSSLSLRQQGHGIDEKQGAISHLTKLDHALEDQNNGQIEHDVFCDPTLEV